MELALKSHTIKLDYFSQQILLQNLTIAIYSIPTYGLYPMDKVTVYILIIWTDLRKQCMARSDAAERGV